MAGLSLTLDLMGNMFQNASHRKQKFCRGPSNDHSWAVWFQLSKWFQRRSVLKHFFHRVQCCYDRTYFNIGPYGGNVSKRFSETT
jgi:hypothetical protein